MAVRRRLDELIHPPGEVEEERVPMVRMTAAGDDVE
jgi:hypothetical protein